VLGLGEALENKLPLGVASSCVWGVDVCHGFLLTLEFSEEDILNDFSVTALLTF
jgi:hypothetical protein